MKYQRVEPTLVTQNSDSTTRAAMLGFTAGDDAISSRATRPVSSTTRQVPLPIPAGKGTGQLVSVHDSSVAAGVKPGIRMTEIGGRKASSTGSTACLTIETGRTTTSRARAASVGS